MSLFVTSIPSEPQEPPAPPLDTAPQNGAEFVHATHEFPDTPESIWVNQYVPTIGTFCHVS